MSKPKVKRTPEFASEAEEQEFWATADTTEYPGSACCIPQAPTDDDAHFDATSRDASDRAQAPGQRTGCSLPEPHEGLSRRAGCSRASSAYVEGEGLGRTGRRDRHGAEQLGLRLRGIRRSGETGPSCERSRGTGFLIPKRAGPGHEVAGRF